MKVRAGRAVTFLSAAILGLALLTSRLPASEFQTAPEEVFDPPRFEIGVQSGYLLGVFGNPHAYEVAPQFITGRIRWGANDANNWTRGYNQFCFTLMAEPITRGIENHYFGINFGGRYNFVQRGWRIVPYFSGGLGLGWIDSRPDNIGSQGQDFTFNILTAIGFSYRIDDHWKVEAAAQYEHFSNGGQTDPNPSLNLIGPQIGVSYSF